MKKTKDAYTEAVLQLREVDRKIKCLSACFKVISEPGLIDSVNYEILALKARRLFLAGEIRRLYQPEK